LPSSSGDSLAIVRHRSRFKRGAPAVSEPKMYKKFSFSGKSAAHHRQVECKFLTHDRGEERSQRSWAVKIRQRAKIGIFVVIRVGGNKQAGQKETIDSSQKETRKVIWGLPYEGRHSATKRGGSLRFSLPGGGKKPRHNKRTEEHQRRLSRKNACKGKIKRGRDATKKVFFRGEGRLFGT